MTGRPRPASLDPPPRGGRARPNAASEIAEELRQQIAGGQLPRGTRLPSERELAQHFGVSQPTVREALRALVTMGLVDIRHGSGTYVTGDSQQFVSRSLETLLQLEQVGIEEILEVRLGLRELIARLAVERATDEDLDALEAAEAAFEHSATETMTQRTTTVLDLLALISRCAHNPLLYALDTYLNRLLIEFQALVFDDRPPEFWRAWAQHFHADRRRLVEALRARDEQAAVAAMRAYHENARRRLTEEPRLARLRMSDPEIIRALGGQRAL